jgi:ribosomal-protein-alanine N-acetyltransferase
MKKNPKTPSTSQKVYLRYPERFDFEELALRYRGSRELFRGVAETKFDRNAFEQLIASADTETKQAFLICELEDDAIVGTITLSQIFHKAFQNAYLGYQLFGGFTGNGYMTEAVDLMLHYAFTDLKLHRVEANVQPNNKPSIAVLKRNGFAKEGFSRRYLKIGGQWRDHERWAILKEDWKPLS